ncbi:MAG: cytochrome c peroxidase [Planctomycetota bacterium]
MKVLLAGLGLLSSLALPCRGSASAPAPLPPRPSSTGGELPEPGLPPVPFPPGNPITAEKALLGKALFWDEQLSSSGTVACGTCHRPEGGGADPRSLTAAGSTHPGLDLLFGGDDDVVGSRGVIRQLADGAYAPDELFGLVPRVTRRRAPSAINAAYSPTLFWDGRAGGMFFDPVTGQELLADGAALESQASAPPVSPVEMAHEGEDWTKVAARIEAASPLRLAHDVPSELQGFIAGKTYPALFALAFGTPEVTPQRIVLALATYQRTLVSDRSRFDDFLAGDASALTAQEQTGLDVFFDAGKCHECHGGSLLTDHGFHDIGVRPDAEDLGRGAVTGLPEDAGRFRTPGLRNVALRAPYFHNGRLADLGDVVKFYDEGGDFEADELIVPLNLSPSKRLALVAFLGTLTDPRVENGEPPFDRPALFSESAAFPQLLGAGTAGQGGLVPETIAVEPATVDNPALRLGVRGALGAAPGVLAIDAALAPAPWTLAGAEVFLAASPLLVASVVGALDGAPDAGAGHATLTFDLATAAPPVGLELFLQWFVLDPGAPAGLASSAATRVTLF